MTLKIKTSQTLHKIQMIISKSNALGQDDTAARVALRLNLNHAHFTPADPEGKVQ